MTVYARGGLQLYTACAYQRQHSLDFKLVVDANRVSTRSRNSLNRRQTRATGSCSDRGNDEKYPERHYTRPRRKSSTHSRKVGSGSFVRMCEDSVAAPP